MKKLFIVCLLSFISTSTALSQIINARPAKEFDISISENVIEVKTGTTKDVTINLQRSKGYLKSNALMSLSSTLPDGVEISFEPATGMMETTTAHITVNEAAKPGRYVIVINGTINNKNKGAMLKLNIKSDNDLTTGL